MSQQTRKEITWTRATVIGLLISAMLLITLGYIPSIFTYWWDAQTGAVVDLIQKTTGYEIEPYTSIRIRDAISLGYQTVAFAIPIVATYVIMERRRRRLGQRGAEDVKGYLPGT